MQTEPQPRQLRHHGLIYRECDSYVVDEVLARRAYQKLAITDGDVVLDLGAHVGSFVQFALSRGAEQVVAVEPTPSTLVYLRANFGGERRVHIYPCAVQSGHLPDHVPLKLTPNPMGTGTSRFLRGSRTVDVPTVTLAHLLAAHRPTKLKFDVEFAEYDTLLPGAQAVTNSPVTRMMGELHTRNAEALALAYELHDAYVSRGWTCSRPRDRWPTKPSGWNVIACFSRDQGGGTR